MLLKTARLEKTKCAKNTHARMSYNMDLPKVSPAVSVDGAMFNILDREQCVWSERTMKEKKKRQQ